MIVRHPEDEDDKLLCQVIKNQCDIGSVQVGVYTIALRLDVAVLPAAAPGGEDEISAVTGRVFVAKTPEVFTYDADGNMTSDGRFAYFWNDENRMVSASNAEVVVTYAYDHKGRMIRKDVMRTGSATVHIEYTWDGWNIIREAVATNSLFTIPSSLFTYNLWGLDLDGTMQGAGGVGGLLAVVRDGDTYIPTYDANGNVSEYISASDGTIASHYDYSPFGETLVASGPQAASFTHRFSTKPWCPVTGFCEYQMRKYNPNLGRWMSRDPIEERGGLALNAFLPNPICDYDYLGKRCCLITVRQGGEPLSGHSILKCDNGLYLSWNPQEFPNYIPGVPWPGENHTENSDFSEEGYGAITNGNLMVDGMIYTGKGRVASVICLDCLDGEKITKPTDKPKSWWGRSWNPGNDCADVTLRAIDEAVGDGQKPKCKCGYYAENILTRNLFQTPRASERAMLKLKENGCNKWECKRKKQHQGGRK